MHTVDHSEIDKLYSSPTHCPSTIHFLCCCCCCRWRGSESFSHFSQVDDDDRDIKYVWSICTKSTLLFYTSFPFCRRHQWAESLQDSVIFCLRRNWWEPIQVNQLRPNRIPYGHCDRQPKVEAQWRVRESAKERKRAKKRNKLTELTQRATSRPWNDGVRACFLLRIHNYSTFCNHNHPSRMCESSSKTLYCTANALVNSLKFSFFPGLKKDQRPCFR